MNEHAEDCPFCAIIAGQERAEIYASWDDAVCFVPLRPVTPGHVLVVPREHVTDAAADPVVAALAAHRAAQVAQQGDHVAVNVGEAAGMTVPHLHWHVWPCRGSAGCMPWGCPENGGPGG